MLGPLEMTFARPNCKRVLGGGAGMEIRRMSAVARLLFFAAWVCPTIVLVGGGLPAERIIAAFCAAALSGALLSALPVRGFRAARLLTVIVLPLSWLWIGYVSLNGMGPTSNDALGALANTNVAEAWTAVHLIANDKSISIGILQALLLAASYACGTPRQSLYSGAIVAASLVVLMANAWIPRLLPSAPAFLPGRDDLQNVTYGSLWDMLDTWVDNRLILGSRSAPGMGRRIPNEPRVLQDIDAIFVLGETFRFERSEYLGEERRAWSSLNERFRAGLGVSLPKVCASADSTAVSVPMLVSGTSPQNHEDAARAPSGLARLAAAGYETAWISNQGAGFFDDERRDLLWMAKGYAHQYDDALLPIASAFLNRKDRRNRALLIHLMDSHADYEDRYPSAAEPGGINDEQREVLRYSRATDHTVMLLAKIAAMIDAIPTPAFAVYVSDHGENLLADHNGIHYHIGARTTAKAAYVPSVVFWNSAFLHASNPNDRLRGLVEAPSLAHADVYRIWMNFAGLPAELSPTADPKILGKAKLTDKVSAIPCTSLSP
jgi:glucan phosphoethanolaminetransferase (alkaline phosphatase superfamily)